MAHYRLLSPNHAELNDGTVLGHEVIEASTINTKHLVKGTGVIKLKEVDASGQVVVNPKQYAFKHGETITVA